MHHQTICLTYDFELGQWVVTQAATAQSALAANVVSTATKNTATPSTDEAKVTTTEPSPASNNNDLFNWNSNLNSNVGLCLDKVCQWLLATAVVTITALATGKMTAAATVVASSAAGAFSTPAHTCALLSGKLYVKSVAFNAAADICHAKPVTAVTGTCSAISTDPAATLVASGGEPATTATTMTATSSPTARWGVRDLSWFLQVQPLRLASKYIHIKSHVESYLNATSYYNHATLLLDKWKVDR
ncbi:unnamed protein product [Sphagnum tenellum]